jgi:hypothetical protein
MEVGVDVKIFEVKLTDVIRVCTKIGEIAFVIAES